MKNLKKLREAIGLSQQKFGQEIGLARNTICQYESGNRVPDVDTLINIADYFNVTIDYLLGREILQTEKVALIERPEMELTSEIPKLLNEKRFVDTAKLYNALPDQYRERVLGVVMGIAIGLGINTDKVLGK